MTKIKSLNILSFARFQALLVSFLGLIAGILLYIAASFFQSLAPPGTPQISSAIGAGAIFITPILYGVIGFILIGVSTLIFEFVVVRVLGIDMSLFDF